jgi:thiamine pyrophosphokinase
LTSGLTAVVFAGGAAPTAGDLADLPGADLTIGADSGFDHAVAHGFACDLLVGDMDSISAAGLERARQGPVEVLSHPADKDQTDLELALAVARGRGATRIIVVGGHGGRLDHQLANVEVLTAPHLAVIEVEARMADSRLLIVRGHRPLDAPIGTIVSILPTGGPAHGVRTTGLRWELAGETLHPGSARGVSNEVVSQPVEVGVDEGVLVVVQPGPPAT